MVEDEKPTGLLLKHIFYKAQIGRPATVKPVFLGYPFVNNSPNPNVLSWRALLRRYIFLYPWNMITYINFLH